MHRMPFKALTLVYHAAHAFPILSTTVREDYRQNGSAQLLRRDMDRKVTRIPKVLHELAILYGSGMPRPLISIRLIILFRSQDPKHCPLRERSWTAGFDGSFLADGFNYVHPISPFAASGQPIWL